jgi:hypothetical protein
MNGLETTRSGGPDGLEVLIIADIVQTITIEPTLTSALTLALIVAVRTFLIFSLEIELEGIVPWRKSRRLRIVAPEGDLGEGGSDQSGRFEAGIPRPTEPPPDRGRRTLTVDLIASAPGSVSCTSGADGAPAAWKPALPRHDVDPAGVALGGVIGWLPSGRRSPKGVQ